MDNKINNHLDETLKELNKQENQRKEIKKEEKRMKAIFNKLFSCQEGIEFLKKLKFQCHFTDYIVNTNQLGDISKDNLLYNEARRGIYLWIRKFLNKEILKKVEIDD